MSNLAALGFSVATKTEAEALARAPLRDAPAHLVLHGDGSLAVHRLELGDGIELWAVRKGKAIVAAWPAFMARRTRREVVERVTFAKSTYTPRLWLVSDPSWAMQVVNFLLIPDGRLLPGVGVDLAVTALVPGGFAPVEAGQELGVTHPAKPGEGDTLYRLTGRVTLATSLTNPVTGVELTHLVLDAGRFGPLEAVCRAVQVHVSAGELATGVGTLRGAVVGFDQAA